MKKYFAIFLLLGCLSACPEASSINQRVTVEPRVTVEISKDLIDSLQGNTGTKGSGSTPSTSSPTPGQPSSEPFQSSPTPAQPSPEPIILPSAEPNVAGQTEKAIFQVIYDNTNAVNNDHFEAFSFSFHVDSPFLINREDLLDSFLELTSAYTYYEILNMALASVSAHTAEALIHVRISNSGGIIERILRYTLRKEDDRWKVFLISNQSGN